MNYNSRDADCTAGSAGCMATGVGNGVKQPSVTRPSPKILKAQRAGASASLYLLIWSLLKFKMRFSFADSFPLKNLFFCLEKQLVPYLLCGLILNQKS